MEIFWAIVKVLLILCAIAGIIGGGKKTLIYLVVGIILLILKISQAIILRKNPDSTKANRIRSQLSDHKKTMTKFYEDGLTYVIIFIFGFISLGLYQLILYFEK